MAHPVVIKDRVVYRGDPYEQRFVFKNPDGTPHDLTGADWEPKLAGAEDWTVDATQAATGIVRLKLTGEQTARITAPFVSWDLYEHNLWGRTLFAGKLRMEGQV